MCSGIFGPLEREAACAPQASATLAKSIGSQFDPELRVALQDHLLPLDLPEHVVLDHDDADLQLVLHQRRNLAHQHGEAAIADDAYHLPPG